MVFAILIKNPKNELWFEKYRRVHKKMNTPVVEMVVGLGFEPRKAWLADLQSALVDHLSTLPT